MLGAISMEIFIPIASDDDVCLFRNGERECLHSTDARGDFDADGWETLEESRARVYRHPKLIGREVLDGLLAIARAGSAADKTNRETFPAPLIHSLPKDHIGAGKVRRMLSERLQVGEEHFERPFILEYTHNMKYNPHMDWNCPG